jgi:hypothetical protein
MTALTHNSQISLTQKLRLRFKLLKVSLRAGLRNRQDANKYFSDIRKFADAGGVVTHIYPIINEYKDQAGIRRPRNFEVV